MKPMAESVTVTWDWLPCGNVELVGGKLHFPRVPAAPGVYRMTFHDDRGQLVGVYVGEADLLPPQIPALPDSRTKPADQHPAQPRHGEHTDRRRSHQARGRYDRTARSGRWNRGPAQLDVEGRARPRGARGRGHRADGWYAHAEQVARRSGRFRLPVGIGGRTSSCLATST
jgi:hypothetical protein